MAKCILTEKHSLQKNTSTLMQQYNFMLKYQEQIYDSTIIIGKLRIELLCSNKNTFNLNVKS